MDQGQIGVKVLGQADGRRERDIPLWTFIMTDNDSRAGRCHGIPC